MIEMLKVEHGLEGGGMMYTAARFRRPLMTRMVAARFPESDRESTGKSDCSAIVNLPNRLRRSQSSAIMMRMD